MRRPTGRSGRSRVLELAVFFLLFRLFLLNIIVLRLIILRIRILLSMLIFSSSNGNFYKYVTKLIVVTESFVLLH